MKIQVFVVAIIAGLTAAAVIKPEQQSSPLQPHSAEAYYYHDRSDEVPEDCLTPPEEPQDCYSGRRWRFDLHDKKCYLERVCGLHGGNKFESREHCEHLCNYKKQIRTTAPPETCKTPKREPYCYPPETDMWRYNHLTRRCHLEPTCYGEGPNKFSSLEDCLTSCNRACFKPLSPEDDEDADPVCAHMGYRVWRYNPLTEVCKEEPVCSLVGENKFLTEKICMETCRHDVDDATLERMKLESDPFEIPQQFQRRRSSWRPHDEEQSVEMLMKHEDVDFK